MKREMLFATSVALMGCATDELVDDDGTQQVDDAVPYSFTSQNEAGDHFGGAVAIADFNGDGFADLAVGAPGESSSYYGWNYGAVYTYRGTSSGGLVRDQLLMGTQFGGFTTSTVGAFGTALAAGDFDGDTRIDLAVGAPRTTVDDKDDAGIVFWYRGTSAGLVPHRVIGQTELGLDGDSAGDLFGTALAAGPIAEDRADTLAIGAPGEVIATYDPIKGTLGNVMTGSVFLVHRPGQGFKATALRGSMWNEEFGSEIAIGDIDGDNRADIVVGSPAYDNDRGRVSVFQGRRPPESGPAWSAMATRRLVIQDTSPSADERFGAAVAIGDFDTNGGDEIAISVRNVDSSGRVEIHSLDSAWANTREFILTGDAGVFGLRIAKASLTAAFGDELVVTASGDGGRVYAFTGQSLLFSKTQTQLYGAPPEVNDFFGAALATSGSKIVVGAPWEAPETIFNPGVEESGAVSWILTQSGSVTSAAFVHQQSSH